MSAWPIDCRIQISVAALAEQAADAAEHIPGPDTEMHSAPALALAEIRPSVLAVQTHSVPRLKPETATHTSTPAAGIHIHMTVVDSAMTLRPLADDRGSWRNRRPCVLAW